MKKRLEGKTALITGASRGIGRAIAKHYAKEGAQLILVARNVPDLESTDDEIRALGSSALLVPLNLCELVQIEAMANDIFKRYGKLDILVGNAGMLGSLSPIHHLKPSVWHDVMTLNLHANWHLIRTFDPLLRKSTAGRAIFVTSSVALRVIPYWGAYAVSKAALEMMVKTYAAETQNSSLRINLVNPGATRTALRAQAMPGEDPLSLPHPEEITEVFVKLAEEACSWHGETLFAPDYKVS